MALMTEKDMAASNLQTQKADIRAWLNRLPPEDQQLLSQKAHSSKAEFVETARDIIQRQQNALHSGDKLRALAWEEQLANQLLAQLDAPDQLMTLVKNFAAKQTIEARTAEEHQKQENMFLRALKRVHELAQQALAPLEKLTPSPLKNLLSDPQKQLAQQTQPQQRQDGKKEPAPGDRVAAGREQDQKVAAKETSERIDKARAAKKEQIAQESKKRLGGGRGKRTASVDGAPQPATSEMQTEDHYANLTQDVINKGIEAGKDAQATLAANGHNLVAAPSTPLAKNTQGVKIPSNSGSMTA